MNNKHDHAHKKDEPAVVEKNGIDEIVTLSKKEFEQLSAEAKKGQESWDKQVRQQADFENIRKRLEKEKQDFVKFANEEIIVELLNILDDLERAVELASAKHEDISAFLKGVEMILAHLYDLLKDHGVKPVETLGKIFDPHFQEALMLVENKELPEHTVVEELQKGYLLDDRVIRTAKVKVTKRGEDIEVNLEKIDENKLEK